MIKKTIVVYSEYLICLRKNNTNVLRHGRGMSDYENKGKISDLKAPKILPNDQKMNTIARGATSSFLLSCPIHTIHCRIRH
ncbi:MAG: hypothetical protein ABH886_05860 [Candidatus Desantisbacteria bacterium]